MTKKNLEDGISLQDFFCYMENFNIKNKPWMTWSEKEKKLLEKECQAKKIKFPLNSKHLNLKVLFSTSFCLQKEISLLKVQEFLKLQKEENNAIKLYEIWRKTLR